MKSTTFGLLKVSGEQAKKFLQGQLTCDMEKVTSTDSLLGAHCNPQGRILFLFRLFQYQDDYYLVMPEPMVVIAQQSLQKYAIFYKIVLQNVTDKTLPLAEKAWQFFDTTQGIAQIYPETSGKYLPHDLNLPHLGGVSFDKGCYTGQEIIARMHYKAKLKTKLFKAKLVTAASLKRGALLTPPDAEIIDFQEADYNSYVVLILTQEENRALPGFKLDPTQNETWQWLE